MFVYIQLNMYTKERSRQMEIEIELRKGCCRESYIQGYKAACKHLQSNMNLKIENLIDSFELLRELESETL